MPRRLKAVFYGRGTRLLSVSDFPALRNTPRPRASSRTEREPCQAPLYFAGETVYFSLKEEVMEKACTWCLSHELLRRYHDTEWGVPVHDDRLLFEHLMLEVMQCGLSWLLMLKKRDIFRRVLADFQAEELAAFTERDIEAALLAPGMIRSRRKVESVAANARAYLAMQKEFGSFHEWLWNFTDGRMLVYAGHDGAVPAKNALSDRISMELKARGFRHLGSITVYSMLQACGIINDHERSCPRFHAVMQGAKVAWIDG